MGSNERMGSGLTLRSPYGGLGMGGWMSLSRNGKRICRKGESGQAVDKNVFCI